MGQIASSSGLVANALASLNVAPQPELSFLEYWLFDTSDQSAVNDDDGIADAGETVDLAITIRNHWGKADPVSVKLEAWAEGAFQPDPYVTMITDTVDYGAVGAFNWDDNGLIYSDEWEIIGVQNPFRFLVDSATPNDHVIPFRLTITSGNGFYPGDPTRHTSSLRDLTLLSRTVRFYREIISTDMTLTKDHYWIIPDQTMIQGGTTVTITQGTQVQFWGVDPANPYNDDPKPYLQVEGILKIIGTAEEPVELFPDPLKPTHAVEIWTIAGSYFRSDYAKVMNPIIWSGGAMYHSYLTQEGEYIHAVCAPTDRSCGGYVILDVPNENSRLIKLGREGLPAYIGAPKWSLVDKNYFNGDPGPNEVVFLQARKVSILTGYRCMTCTPETGRAGNWIRNNAFLNNWWKPDPSEWLRIVTIPYYGRGEVFYLTDNYWGTTSETLINAAIYDQNDDF